MRELTSHKVNGCNKAITITPVGEPGPGGAHTRYDVRGPSKQMLGVGMVPSFAEHIKFQRGDPAVSVNGVTNEALLAIVADRLEGFQRGPFACEENAAALTAVHGAMAILAVRAAKRESWLVDGLKTV